MTPVIPPPPPPMMNMAPSMSQMGMIPPMNMPPMNMQWPGWPGPPQQFVGFAPPPPRPAPPPPY